MPRNVRNASVFIAFLCFDGLYRNSLSTSMDLKLWVHNCHQYCGPAVMREAEVAPFTSASSLLVGVTAAVWSTRTSVGPFTFLTVSQNGFT
jgi:hypothetical protein